MYESEHESFTFINHADGKVWKEADPDFDKEGESRRADWTKIRQNERHCLGILGVLQGTNISE